MVFGSVALAVALAAAPRLAYQGEKPSRWEELEEGERTATTIISGAMLLILAGLVWRQLGKRKAPPQDPAKLHRWFHGYHYDWATGTVTNVTDMTRETDRIVVRTSRGIEYQPLPANEAGVSRTMVSEEATILFDGGKHDISVSFSGDVYDGLAFPVFHECEGHRITAIWRRRLRGEERGEYVVFRDWTTAGLDGSRPPRGVACRDEPERPRDGVRADVGCSRRRCVGSHVLGAAWSIVSVGSTRGRRRWRSRTAPRRRRADHCA